jgi:hypothetical protein
VLLRIRETPRALARSSRCLQRKCWWTYGLSIGCDIPVICSIGAPSDLIRESRTKNCQYVALTGTYPLTDPIGVIHDVLAAAHGSNESYVDIYILVSTLLVWFEEDLYSIINHTFACIMDLDDDVVGMMYWYVSSLDPV